MSIGVGCLLLVSWYHCIESEFYDIEEVMLISIYFDSVI